MTRKNKRQSKIKILDWITIDLCASVFPWASFRARKAGIKLHTVITDMLPRCVILTAQTLSDSDRARPIAPIYNKGTNRDFRSTMEKLSAII